MEKIQYDFAFPLGAACAATMALRLGNLQFVSLPLDWAGGGDVVGRARLVVDGFKDWMRLEDMELTDVVHASFHSSIYRNRKTGLTFPHDFTSSCYLEDELPDVVAKYEKRIARLYSEIAKAKRVLVIYNEIPYRPVAAEADVVEAQRLLQSRFPETRIDLVYFAQDPEYKDREPRFLNDRTTMVLLDYHSMDHGYVSVAALYHKMTLFLSARYTVPDCRTPEQKARFAAAEAEKDRARWGVGFRHWINKRAYRLYRHLEKYLQAQGCIPNMARPMKMYKDRGERRQSLADPDISFLPRDEEALRRAQLML